MQEEGLIYLLTSESVGSCRSDSIRIFREFRTCFPPLTGPHTVNVTYDGVPVPNSPFRVNVTEGCHPSRVKAQGPGLKEAFTNQPNAFSVVTR